VVRPSAGHLFLVIEKFSPLLMRVVDPIRPHAVAAWEARRWFRALSRALSALPPRLFCRAGGAGVVIGKDMEMAARSPGSLPRCFRFPLTRQSSVNGSKNVYQYTAIIFKFF